MFNKNHEGTRTIAKPIFNAINKTVLLLLILATTGCFMCGDPLRLCTSERSLQNQQNLSLFGNFPNPSDLKIVAEHNNPGQSPAFISSAFIPANALQTYEAIVRFPPSFTVSPNGFADISPVGTSIGKYEIDVNNDGITDLEFPVLSESPFFAWMDINGNEMKDFSEPEIFQSQDMLGNRLLVLTVPNGGDNSPSNNSGNIGFNMSLHLNAGLFINPQATSNHYITASIQSVDPDTGGMNNGSGLEPEIIDLEALLIIDLIFKSDFE